jgi:hypothetical protein
VVSFVFLHLVDKWRDPASNVHASGTIMADPFSILNWKRHWWAFQLVATSINVFTFEPSLSGRGPNPIAHKTHVHHSRTSPSSRCGVPYFLKTRNMLHCKVGPCVATCPILLICCFNQPLTLFSFSCYCVAIARKNHMQCH